MAKPEASDQGMPAKEPRGARRKRETRQRLMKAALELMSARGMDGVAINEITEAADVGFGSFYNHFDSKEAIHAALVTEVLDSFGVAMDHIAENLEDPAEILCTAVRYAVKRAGEKPLWGRFLLRTGFSADIIAGGMGQYMLRDLQRGVASGRFKMDDPLMAFASVGGTVMGAITAQLEFAPENSPVRALAVQLGLNMENIPERTGSTVLQILGLDKAEAEEVANRPLPAVVVESTLL